MKSNLISKLIFFLMICINISHSYSEELKFEATSIEIIDKDKIIIAKEGVKILSGDEIVIDADQMRYNKEEKFLKASGNIIILNQIENIEISSDDITYDKNIEKIVSSGNVEIKFKNDYTLKTKEMIYLKNSKEILINYNTKIKDTLGNEIEFEQLNYNINDKLIKGKKVKLFDLEGNFYNFDSAIIDFSNNQIIADNVSIDFDKKIFGNLQNDPRLKGNYFFSDGKNSIIKKGVFTSCKKNDDCPPWQIKAREINHDKEKKIINYKHAWLEIYDQPIIYFPKFFHPDPTVKRQSGFLMPQVIDSSSLGLSFKLPYYKVISDNKDLTFSPRIFSENEGLFQNEYRQVNKNSKHIADFSLKKKDSTSKTHFFSNSLAKLSIDIFDVSEIEMNLEATSDDNYLKTHNIKSAVNDNQSLLNSFLIFRGSSRDMDLETKIEAYEDLTVDKSGDKYEYIFPSYEFSKRIKSNYNGDYEIISKGNYKNYNTNIFEKVLINDLKFSSNPKITPLGFINKFNLLFKNITSEGDNSSNYKNKFNSENYGSVFYDISYPMKKEGELFDSFFTAKSSLMYSPNSNKDLKTLDRKIDFNNIFTQNRLSLNDSVEGGQSLTLGGEYSLKEKESGSNIFKAGLATVLRDNEEINLPTKSTLNNKGSDFVGSLKFEPNKNLKFDYNFSMDSDFQSSNYNLLKTDISVNKFVTSFEFLQEDDEVGSESYLSNETAFNFNNSNSLKYRTRRNKKTDFTEFYNLIYEYKNDCLTASIQYNKDFYSDNELKPTEEIFFSISIVPLATLNTPSVR
ncbi:LPS assembly protein LptD [Candidatus Pelagibacter sp.]|nr:LPS assembly protein LptD [Candidatus Pelagibacter sp.]